MPRTKVANSKRNRDTGKEEKLKSFDMQMDIYLTAFEVKAKHQFQIVNSMIETLLNELPTDILKMKLSDLQELDLKTIPEVKSHLENNKAMSTSMMLCSSKMNSKDDEEGNMTANSNFSEKTIHLIPPSQYGKTPRIGMMSAKAKSRRSRSAGPTQSSTLSGSAMKTRNRIPGTEHSSRSKVRTAMPTPKPRAVSADNDKILVKANQLKSSPKSPCSPASWLRWPKPGERVISLTGTPLVSYTGLEKFANVNIPVEDGVLSLKPGGLEGIDKSLVQKIGPEALKQIKLLQSNLNKIMEFADFD